ncbi:MAG: MGMT family protein [Chitinophagaceae bacterium]|nr:MGMT family protein [Chitinophagaceae bacterium]
MQKDLQTDWIEKIYRIVRRIPKGKVTSYGAIAECIGTRTTARMVGWAMNASHNARPAVPAHRVVNRNGLLTGKHHFATPTLMQELLAAEGIFVEQDRILDFKKHYWLPDENNKD